ncbi:RNA 2',3'-cyclic phosphodiesterase [Gemmobacter serpentinus]|uniref:RNA 2',3'-cyclic phosphodiesterase n=1 Tax=Gemmobacter serpentinus TaxID=2652247 RepID=UPI00124D1BF0|nr:RNA 2',3'-cyclic phosphodiesterase [Gemmobacter serpentinus]
MIRTFIALPIPEDLHPRLALLQALLPLPEQVEAQDFHITLAFLGAQPVHVLEALHEGLEAVQMPQFVLEMAGVNAFGGAKPRVVWAGLQTCAPLMRLQAKVAQVAVRAGIAVKSQGFTPHVTLGRFTPPPPDHAARLEAAMVAQQGFRAGPWSVTEFALYASYPAHAGPRYELMARYPLA